MTELKKMNIKAYRSINMRKCDPPPKKTVKYLRILLNQKQTKSAFQKCYHKDKFQYL